MKFLIIEQDLRISGTSQGVISRSFLAKLRKVYNRAVIDVHYLKHFSSDDNLDLLPVDNLEEHFIDTSIPFWVKQINKIYWRVFHKSLNEEYRIKQYSKVIIKIDYTKYDIVFIRTAGLDAEMLLALKNLPVLSQSIITFNEAFPEFWSGGSTKELISLDLFKIKKMFHIVENCKGCIATKYLARDMQFLYGSRKRFFDLPHQYDRSVFKSFEVKNAFEKKKKITLSYHGALQFGRDIEILLSAFKRIIVGNSMLKDLVEIVLRLKSSDFNRLHALYNDDKNIRILEGTCLETSIYEQSEICDINILLENGPLYGNALLGKAPLLAEINKPIFCLSADSSELREAINTEFVASYSNPEEVYNKLKTLLHNFLNNDLTTHPFGSYFSDKVFKTKIKSIVSYHTKVQS